VPPELIAALIDVESRWNPRAVSDKGAMGLMQLMPATARRYGANHPFDVEENIAAGTRYVTALMWEFHGDMRLVSAAYYAGDRWIAEKRLNYNNPDVVAYVEAVRVAAQQMLLMAARANPLISILERGDSYQPLVELMGGEMIEMSLDSDQTINPWDLPKGDERPSNDQISFLKNLTRHMLGENTPPDLDIDLLDSVLLEAIGSTYKRCSAKTSNPIPLFGDLAAELAHWQDRDRNQKINAMAQMASTKLRAWVDEGPYARLFDRPTTVELNNPWLYFNVEKLKDDPRLERAMSLLIAHTATYRASGITGRPSIVLLDECWALLESPILASVVVQLFRTARKRNASVWGISQAPEDFVGTPDKPNEHGAGIVKNATTKIIGKQPGDMTALREHVHLNETALNQIKTFAHPKKGHSAEFLIAIGEKAESTHAIRIVPSPVDYWITTTYARERTYRMWWMRKHASIARIAAYEALAERFPRGLAELAPLKEELSGEVQEVLAQ
jgi:hypothetical protein